MKITCEQKYLNGALAAVRRVMSTRNTMPILSHVLFEAGDGFVRLMATDLDTVMHYRMPATVDEHGAVVIPAQALTDIVGKMDDGAIIKLACDGTKVKVTSGKSVYNLLSLPAEDYPVVPPVGDGVTVAVPQAALRDMLRMTAYACSKEETRSLLMGVLFEARGSMLILVATDTHRLAWKQANLASAVESPVSAIIPGSPLAELASTLGNNQEPVTITFGTNQVQFDTGDVQLVSRLLGGQYPQYEKVIPRDFDKTITCNREQLLKAIRRVYVVAASNAEKMIVTTKSGDLGGTRIELTAQSQEMGDALEEVPCEFKGDNIQIAFCARYVVELLTIMQCNDVTLKLTGPLNPALIEGVGDASYRSVVMPMQVG